MRELPGNALPVEPIEFELTNYQPAMEALLEERIRRNIRLFELEEHSGVSMNSLYAWSVGARSPTLVHLCALATSLGFEVVLRRCADTPQHPQGNPSDG
jgi:transcriptional regulator with XRE-family HTH domain